MVGLVPVPKNDFFSIFGGCLSGPILPESKCLTPPTDNETPKPKPKHFRKVSRAYESKYDFVNLECRPDAMNRVDTGLDRVVAQASWELKVEGSNPFS